jgi:hypothetical protein
LQVLRSACDWQASSQGLFMAVQGNWQLEGTGTQMLLPQQGLWWSDAVMAWRLIPQSSDAILLALKILR